MASSSARRGLEDEDASTLTFGPDFQDAACLLNSEVALMLESRLTNSAPSTQQKGNFLKAYEYVNRVKTFRDRENTTRARAELDKKKELHGFERVQLGNLCLDEPDEAMKLIPSLQMNRNQLDPGELSDLLATLKSFRQLT
ncbi:hypothetical protein AB1Y20_018148 [Prymnesium parvum]|uniref:RNA polymerase Rpb4/RPC9 core domain-containing protein n=1 Tax=Prymnesium parvum TaxID=97485 RepID=A0AB34JQU4_PRYPA